MKSLTTSIVHLKMQGDIIYARLADGIDFDKQIVIELQETLEKLAEGKKYKVLLDATNTVFGSLGDSVFDNAVRTDIAVNRVAQAFVTNILPTKIMVNFYSNTIKPPFPTKVFKTIAEAEEWLNSIVTSGKEIAGKWFEAFNRHDLEGLLSLYDAKAIHFSPKLLARYPETKGLISGKEELRNWWKESFDNLPTLKYFPEMIISENENVFMKYKRTVNGQEDLIVGETLKIVNGLIVESRVFHS